MVHVLFVLVYRSLCMARFGHGHCNIGEESVATHETSIKKQGRGTSMPLPCKQVSLARLTDFHAADECSPVGESGTRQIGDIFGS